MRKKSMGTGKPSKRQAEVLEFIVKFQKARGYSPSLSEIAKHFKVSVPTIHQHVAYLRKKNLLLMQKGRRRSIQPLNDRKNDLLEIPLLGRIAAGGPIEAIRNPESIEVPRSMLSRGANHY